MIQNRFEEFDKILFDNDKRTRKYKNKYQKLKSIVEPQVANLYYGKSNLYLGHFCPSLIIDYILGKWKREKLRKSKPKSKDYVTYEVDSQGKLLRTSECVEGQPVFETYIIRETNEEYSITFLNQNPVSNDNVRAIYYDNKIIRFDIIGTAYIWSDVYIYRSESEISCKHFYYVPDLLNSHKSIEAGKPNSPMIQNNFKINFDLEGNRNIEIDTDDMIQQKTAHNTLQ
jgi:hypothetical protein